MLGLIRGARWFVARTQGFDGYSLFLSSLAAWRSAWMTSFSTLDDAYPSLIRSQIHKAADW